MAAPNGSGQPFHGATGQLDASGWGCCWQFDDRKCRLGADCQYQHECFSFSGLAVVTEKRKKEVGLWAHSWRCQFLICAFPL